MDLDLDRDVVSITRENMLKAIACCPLVWAEMLAMLARMTWVRQPTYDWRVALEEWPFGSDDLQHKRPPDWRNPKIIQDYSVGLALKMGDMLSNDHQTAEKIMINHDMFRQPIFQRLVLRCHCNFPPHRSFPDASRG